jgi:hypothetical protein
MRQQWRASQGCGGRYAQIGVCQRVSAIFFCGIVIIQYHREFSKERNTENVGFERRKRSELSEMCSLRLAIVERLPPNPALLAFFLDHLVLALGSFRLRLCQCALLLLSA